MAGSQLWLAVSADRRVSVWSADWSRDSCELVDWLSFPAPAFTPDGILAKGTDSVSNHHTENSLFVWVFQKNMLNFNVSWKP